MAVASARKEVGCGADNLLSAKPHLVTEDRNAPATCTRATTVTSREPWELRPSKTAQGVWERSSWKPAGHKIPGGWQGFRNKDGLVSKAGQTGKVSYRHFTSPFLNIYEFGALLACPLKHSRVRVFSLLFCFSSKLETCYSLELMTLRIYEHDWFIWHGSRIKNEKWLTKSFSLIPC